MYKAERSVHAKPYEEIENQPFKNAKYVPIGPNPKKFNKPGKTTNADYQNKNFFGGLAPFGDNEHILQYNYHFGKSMSEKKEVFHNMDGEFLIQPSQGRISILTELGILQLKPGTIGVIPKNMKIQVNLSQGETEASGVITELKNDRSFRLPGKGPIGANGLANSEYFESPVPFVDQQNMNATHKVLAKNQNIFYESSVDMTPFCVYAWKGNYAPYRFNLDDFVPIVAAQKDHLDPSSHLVLAVPASEGLNYVEFVAFTPRINVSTDKNPTYLTPWDHRNNGKTEIMHYLGAYDARKDSIPGQITVHDMGIAHGNDNKTFLKSRFDDNKTVYLDNPHATMVETSGYLRIVEKEKEQEDKEYHQTFQSDTKTKHLNPFPIGKSKQITLTAFEPSITPLFDAIMPDPEINFNEKTGNIERNYVNGSGDVFSVRSNQDQNNFWKVFKGMESEQYVKRDFSQCSDKEIMQASKTIVSFLNKGTIINSLNLLSEKPSETTQNLLNHSLKRPLLGEENAVSIDEDAFFSFKFQKESDFDKFKPNPKALVSTIDHTVINCYKNSLNDMFTLFPKVFWGGDPRDLRAPGVQFYTRVLTNDIANVPQMVPVNNLDELEEEILDRIQRKDTFVPPYLKEAVLKNQISRGLYDCNKCEPKNSRNAFLQHIAMAVNQEYGDIATHLENFKSIGLQLIPAPSKGYYKLTEIDISQRVVIPTLFLLQGLDAFEDIPYEFFNGLLKPMQGNIERLKQILLANKCSDEKIQQIIKCYQQQQPVYQYIGENCFEIEKPQFKTGLENVLNQQNFKYAPSDLELIVRLVDFNHKKIDLASQIGTLLDYQIIQGRCISGYIDQTFSTPVTQLSEGTSGIFFEFIVRTCYDDVLNLIGSGGQINLQSTEFKSCGAFGQGNFANLMLGQQLGIEEIDNQRKIAQAKGYSFELPKIDLDTIRKNPMQHYYDYIEKAPKDKQQQLKNIAQNIEETINECKRRNLWY